MDWLIPILVFVLLVLTGALVYFSLRIRRGKKHPAVQGKNFDFRPSIGFARQDGWKSVALLLENESDVHVWTEEIEFALNDLIANQQASEASCHEILKIHQTVSPNDMLPISLVETIYQAAGRPQRKYSCILSSIVRYRAGEKWFEEPMQTYRLKMIGLTVADIRREHKTVHQFKPRDQSQDLHTVDANSK